MRAAAAALLLAALLGLAGGQQTSGPPLSISVIDVEGGQATLVVTHGGEAMLVDAGYPGFGDRDAERIAAEAKRAGVRRIDFMVVTHYHLDHVGGVPPLAARIPMRTFVDHGPLMEEGEGPAALFAAYEPLRAKGHHLPVRPGDRVPISGLDVRVVSSAGDLIQRPLMGAATPNPLCAGFTPQADDRSENARSVGIVITYGRFRLLNLGDLTWNKEHGLVCPDNLLGQVDVYLTSHHGLSSSGPAALVHAVRPRVALMNNGATKGGAPEALRIVRSSPGLEDLWQLHYATSVHRTLNTPEPLIANTDESTAHPIRLTAYQDGRFRVINARNGVERTYAERK